MRKKQHKKLNPDNKEYDKFYLVNYLEPGRDWRTLQEAKDERDEDDDQEWSDWDEKLNNKLACLFCSENADTIEDLGVHMSSVHSFDIGRLKQWPFYDKIKFVNYVRRCAFQHKCFYCHETFSDSATLSAHFESTSHCASLPEKEVWSHTGEQLVTVKATCALRLRLLEFFFPTYENDNLLYNLDDDNAVGDNEDCGPVISENDE